MALFTVQENLHRDLAEIVIGLDVTIYDSDLDRSGETCHASSIAWRQACRGGVSRKLGY